MPTCAIYVRTARLSDGHGDPRAMQLALCAEFAFKQRWRLQGVYVEEPVSGMTRPEERPEFSKMLDALKAGDIDLILVYDLDRISRRSDVLDHEWPIIAVD